MILMCVLFFIQGLGQGFTDLGKYRSYRRSLEQSFLGGTNIILAMWGVNAASPLNIAQLGYGIGAIFVNILVQPFLGENNLPINSTNYNTSTSSDAHIVVPYTIIGTICTLIAIGFLYFYIKELQSQRQKLQLQEVNRKCVIS